MAGFKISKKTRKYQRVTTKEVKEYKKLIYRHIEDNSTRLMTILDIAREVAIDHSNQYEIDRVARILRNMQAQNKISKHGGKIRGYWSKVNERDRIQPTYVKPTPVEQEEEETKPVETTEDKAESPTAKVPVQKGPIFQDVIPVRRQPVQVDRTPRRITITIDV